MAVQPGAIPRGEHPGDGRAGANRRLRTYGGRDRGRRKKAAEKQVGGAVADVRGAHQGVARGGRRGGVAEEKGKEKEKTEAEKEGEELWGKW